MKKNILIVTRQMVAGGIEKSIINMLKMIPMDQYNIHLHVMHKGGEFETEIPNGVIVKCIYGGYKTTVEKICIHLYNLQLKEAFNTIVYSLLRKFTKSEFKKQAFELKLVEKDMNEYDIAIADHVPASFPVMYISNNINAKKKVAWLHSDVSLYKNQIDLYQKDYEKYDYIFSVSEENIHKFNSFYPHLANKTNTFYNLIVQKELELQALDGRTFNDNYNGIRILTIGRLCEQKGQMIIPSVAKKLIENGYRFKWYCIGDGELRNNINSNIIELNVSEHVILLGSISNPYRYLKECDIYIQPSKHECYCTTVTEAKCFNKPIVLCDFNASHEQIENYKTGLITKYDDYELYKSIKYIIENEEVRKLFSKNLSKENNNTQNELQKLYSMI